MPFELLPGVSRSLNIVLNLFKFVIEGNLHKTDEWYLSSGAKYCIEMHLNFCQNILQLKHSHPSVQRALVERLNSEESFVPNFILKSF